MKYAIFTLTVAVFAFAGCATLMGRAEDQRTGSVQRAPTAVSNEPATVNLSEITYTDGEWDGKEIVHTDAEWHKLLPADQYAILREADTEPAFTGSLTDNHKKGSYYCAACGLIVFRSEAKFESGTGWPSFFKPAFRKNVIEKQDNTLPGEVRTEILCSRCHSHLGHVFDDGPKPTGLRYCMNSLALSFKPDAK